MGGRVIAVAPIAARLRERVDAPVIEIGELADPTPPAAPAIYVFCERVLSLPGAAISVTRQLQELTIAVQVFVRSAGAARTAGVTRELLPELVQRVDAALVGWTAPGTDTPLEHVETALVALQAHQLQAIARYRAQRLLSEERGD